jgi:PelA/Pel-15E family pectate lyase
MNTNKRTACLARLTAMRIVIYVFVVCQSCFQAHGSEPLANEARAALRKAVAFFHDQIAVEGGYVYQVSEDLQYREGEGIADPKTVWVQPPGTPAVGLAMLEAYQRTGEPALLKAATGAGHCLVRGQLQSGGWQAHIDFSPELRPKMAYRVEAATTKKSKNYSSFDDDKTQSAVRFLSKLDAALEFRDPKIHESVLFALDSILENQFPNGGWAQVYENAPSPESYPVLKASYPDTWLRKHPGEDYWVYYTLNDNNITRTVETLFNASEIYQDQRYRQSALKGADFLVLAQMPEPQPAWSQQYNFEMQPVWARKFEPPAISGSESQSVIKTLLTAYIESGDRKYLEPIPRALKYLESSVLPDGKLARFYELQTNRPLYMTREYQLTDSPDDLPTHYGFIVKNDLAKLRKDYEKISKMNSVKLDSLRLSRRTGSPKEAPSEADVRRIIESMDSRGAWVESGKLRYHKGKEKQQVNQVITSETFISNLNTLARFLASQDNLTSEAKTTNE